MRQRPYHGVLQIVRFNWHQYISGMTAFIGGAWVLASVPLPFVARLILGVSVCLTAFWWMASLIVSHHVYDRSGLTQWDWVATVLRNRPKRWINIHSGFDETTLPLRHVFPNSESTVVDIFDEREMTEASIHRARTCATGAPTPVRACFSSLPAGDGEVDVLFVLFTAHEIRRETARRLFFEELNRVLTAGGRVLLVEHVRDFWNFLAFGPGCWHFLPKQEWTQRAVGAGFVVEQDFNKTRFVHAWLLRKER